MDDQRVADRRVAALRAIRARLARAAGADVGELRAAVLRAQDWCTAEIRAIERARFDPT